MQVLMPNVLILLSSSVVGQRLFSEANHLTVGLSEETFVFDIFYILSKAHSRHD